MRCDEDYVWIVKKKLQISRIEPTPPLNHQVYTPDLREFGNHLPSTWKAISAVELDETILISM